MKVPGYRSVISDENYKNEMSIKQIRQVLERVAAKGIKIDVIGFDACLMGMAEIYYELADVTNIVIASEQNEPGAGWPYKKILGNMKSYDSEQFAKLVVSTYVKSYKVQDAATMAAIDTKKFKKVIDTFFTKYTSLILQKNNVSKSNYLKLRSVTQKYQSFTRNQLTDIEYGDLIDFLTKASDANSKKMAELLASTVIANANSGGNVKNSFGISVYLPIAKVKSEYANLQFAINSGWGKLLSQTLK